MDSLTQGAGGEWIDGGGCGATHEGSKCLALSSARSARPWCRRNQRPYSAAYGDGRRHGPARQQEGTAISMGQGGAKDDGRAALAERRRCPARNSVLNDDAVRKG